MARVIALVPDLLFGSNVQGSLTGAGHDVALIVDERRLRERLSDPDAPRGEVLVVDLTDPSFDGVAIVNSLATEGLLDGVRTLAFFAHVDTAVGQRARDAGLDLVVPRSRMAREGAQLVARLAGES